MNRRLFLETAFFTALAAAGLAAAVALLFYPIDIGGIAPSDKNFSISGLQPVAGPSRLRSPTRVSTITARPLFSKSRQPFRIEVRPAPAVILEPPIAPALPAAPEPPMPVIAAETLLLKGVLLHAQTARALIASDSNPAGIWLEPGGVIHGWKVQHIAPETVRLAQDDRTTELKLYARTGTDELIGP